MTECELASVCLGGKRSTFLVAVASRGADLTIYLDCLQRIPKDAPVVLRRRGELRHAHSANRPKTASLFLQPPGQVRLREYR